MRIYCLFRQEPGFEVPWLVDAVDEYTIDELGDVPEKYAKERADKNTREIVIKVPDKAVMSLFEAPEVEGKVVDE